MVEIGDESYEARAATATGEERDRLWVTLTANHPFFADHQAKIERVIPVVVLERVRPVG
jgi:F420H(2)-dependent quinone reductase